MSLSTNFLVAIAPPSPSPSSTMNSTNRRTRRPKGLWKARVTLTVTEPRFLGHRPYNHHHRSKRSWDDNDVDTDDETHSSISTSSQHKKIRLSSPAASASDEEDHWNCPGPSRSPPGSPVPEEDPKSFDNCCTDRKGKGKAVEEDRVVSRARIMDISSVGSTTASSKDGKDGLFNYEDWEDLKDLFTSAAEQYETAEAAEALPLIRGVIHECHRFQKDYFDPSTLFANPSGSRAQSPNTTPPEGTANFAKISFDKWPPARTSSTIFPVEVPPASERKKCTCRELPTAFHAIFGTALFLFGNLIAQDPSLCLPGEPDSPNAYWMAALDVFETGENLPTRTHGLSSCDAPEDWRMAIVWGRTLVCLADERIVKESEENDGKKDGASTSASVYQSPEEPKWAPDSPFSIIAQRRPPVTGRMSLTTATPNELLKFAMDQFSRGIFHMPHPEQRNPSGQPSNAMQFSRAKELFTLASEVLLVSEKLTDASERKYWASWADSVFNQMKMESSSPQAYTHKIDFARGRCCLIVGSALSEQFDEALEKGDMSVLDDEDADEAREMLTDAIGFFEKARGRGKAREEKKEKEKSVKTSRKRKRELDDDGEEAREGVPSSNGKAVEVEEECQKEPEEANEDDDLQDLLAEALLTLANLTKDDAKREELYTRAEKESRSGLNLAIERLSVDDDEE